MFYSKLSKLVIFVAATASIVAADMPADCVTTYQVQFGDDCFNLAIAKKIPNRQILALNPVSAKNNCVHLDPGEVICLASKQFNCQRVVVDSGEVSCTQFIDKFGITAQEFEKVNFGRSCNNLNAQEVYCVDKPSA